MLKKDFFKSVLWSFSFASLVFAFQNCSSPFHGEAAFVSNVKPRAEKSSTAPLLAEPLRQPSAQNHK